jgi:hypothetical protein
MRTIHDWLGSDETGRPFSHCLRCRFPLVEIAEPWLVNKEFINDECVLEYAVCQPCRDEVTDQLSEASKESARQFLEHEIDWEKRMREFILARDVTSRFAACIACCTPRDHVRHFGLSALFDSSGSLVEGPLPLLICQPCIGRMTVGFSEQSREVWRRFLAENFPGPSGDAGFPGWF